MKEFPTRPLVYQSGSALMIILALILLAFTASLTTFLPSLNRDAKTANANAAVLAQAKAALIAYAVTAGSKTASCASTANCRRPGDLPCPDMTTDNVNSGTKGTSCDQNGAPGQTKRLGRLPWKTLGLPPDLRDASGNRLWYAVSIQNQDQNRNTPLNSDTFGTITVRNANGNVVNNGSNPSNIPSGVVAVIIAPGAPITRQDGHQQKRTNNAANEYLDIATLNGITEDNADFVDGSAINGFIQGPIKDSQGNFIVNDQMVVITYDEIMPLIERRVAAEAMMSLQEYYTAYGQYPGPAAFNDDSCLGNIEIKDFICPNSTLSSPAYPWCNNTSRQRNLSIDCSLGNNLRHPLCAIDPLFTPAAPQTPVKIEVVCSGGTTPTAVALNCSPSVPSVPPNPANNCGSNLTLAVAASACTYTGTQQFTVEACSGRTQQAQATPLNCGRIPAGTGLIQPIPSLSLTNGFINQNKPSWFQSNGWRELVFYALAPSLLPGSVSCGSAGTLTVTDFSTPPAPQLKTQNLVVIVAGRTLSGQSRSGTNKLTLSNYLERANTLQPWNGTSITYSTISPRSPTFNDVIVSTSQ